MKVSSLLEGIEYTYIESKSLNADDEITAVCYDTRKITPGAAFICICGAVHDSHDYAAAAAKAGARLIITEHEVEATQAASVIRVTDTRLALAVVSANFFSNPSRKLTTIAITGTKGKSTTAYMIRNILEAAGIKTGIIGTIGVGIGDRVYSTQNTTPEPYLIQQYLRQMVDEGCKALVMEVSSQGLKQNRVGGIIYDYAVFTNLEPDHIGTNEHADYEEYRECKSRLFKISRLGIFNADDKETSYMVSKAACDKEFFGIDSEADVMAEDIELIGQDGKIGIAYKLKGALEERVELSIPCRFNIYNSLAAISVCRHITQDFEAMKTALYKTHVLGRLEPINISNRFSLMIDYAHNAMALESLLKTLREYNPKRLVCLFGCGGNRSRDRRYEMGEVSGRYADFTVITDDNPRYEKPEDIVNDILVGMKKTDGNYIVIPNRRNAIRYVIENAMDGDLIVLAGKGNEDYQEIEGKKYHMDEREIVAEIVNGRS